MGILSKFLIGMGSLGASSALVFGGLYVNDAIYGAGNTLTSSVRAVGFAPQTALVQSPNLDRRLPTAT